MSLLETAAESWRLPLESPYELSTETAIDRQIQTLRDAAAYLCLGASLELHATLNNPAQSNSPEQTSSAVTSLQLAAACLKSAAVVENDERAQSPDQSLHFMWLEITGKCPLACKHCYAESSAEGTQGTMSTEAWLDTVSQAAELGVGMVQFIGGEPTTHPDLTTLIDHALESGIEVEVFSNLVHVTEEQWSTFEKPGVRLATSYYSSDPSTHAAITRSNRNSHRRTLANITEARRRGISLRVGVIEVQEGQDVEAATRQLVIAGVDPDSIGYDTMRQVGRGTSNKELDMDQLCGNCADGVLAVMPDGTVSPCVFSRQLEVGNVQETTLSHILAGNEVATTRSLLNEYFDGRNQPSRKCNPLRKVCPPKRTCKPAKCLPDATPGYCRPTCSPNCTPSTGCEPSKNPSERCMPDAL